MPIQIIKKTLKPVRRIAGRALLKAAHKVPSDYISAVLFHTVHHRRLSSLLSQNTFSERIALRNVKPHPMYESLTDKYDVRAFVKGKVGSDYLIPIYGIIGDVEDLDFSALPNTFVMKATHGSGWVRLVEDLSKENTEDLRMLAKSWLSENFYPVCRESHYKFIKPRVIFEKLLFENGIPVDDYKVHCFRKNGRLTQVLQIHSDRFGSHKVNFFSSNWKPLDMSHGYDRAPAETIRKPDELEHLLDVADRLSTGMNYVRVDLYVSSGRVFFGELTFTPGAGLLRFHPREADRHWATLFDRDNHSHQDTSSEFRGRAE